MKLRLKRVYDAPSVDDGLRVLVDRLWPRGLDKASARIDLWARDIAPSNELRKWFGHEPQKWPQFQDRYLIELEANRPAVTALIDHLGDGTASLLYAARDEDRNNAVVLRAFIHRLCR